MTPQVTVIGGGMITQVQILPSLYHLQRLGVIGAIAVCGRTGRRLQALAEDQTLRDAFPGQTFVPYPDFTKVKPEETFPELFKTVIRRIPRRSIVFVALPDQLHYGAIIHALENDQHVITVKPLVLKYKEAQNIEALARQKGLFVGIEYHKRFDDRALMARMQYRAGNLGEFKLAQALLLEPYYYRNSNFQNWCTCENSDMFTYIGCHYVDQVHFITGLRPVSVSVYGIADQYPNGRAGYLWTDARVLWENGASLSVLNALGYPDAAPGGNAQGLRMYNKGTSDGCLLFHDDQYRGVKMNLNRKGTAPGDEKTYHEPSPDYFKLLYRGGKGLEPVGYGYRSIEALIQAVRRVETGGGLAARRKMCGEIDAEGILATPANSAFNELVIEGGRLSITHEGRPVTIEYGAKPRVRCKEFDRQA